MDVARGVVNGCECGPHHDHQEANEKLTDFLQCLFANKKATALICFAVVQKLIQINVHTVVIFEHQFIKLPELVEKNMLNQNIVLVSWALKALRRYTGIENIEFFLFKLHYFTNQYVTRLNCVILSIKSTFWIQYKDLILFLWWNLIVQTKNQTGSANLYTLPDHNTFSHP